MFLVTVFGLLVGVGGKCALLLPDVYRNGGVRAVRAYAQENGLSMFVPERSGFWLDLYGCIQRCAGVDVILDEDRSVYRLNNGAVTFLLQESDGYLPEEIRGLQILKNTAEEIGAQCWLVSIPRKLCMREVSFSARGVGDSSQARLQTEINAFRRAGYSVLDLHSEMHAQGLRHSDLYYKTDHHWKTETALWAARELAQSLGMDASALDACNFEQEIYPSGFLGSEGKHCGRIYCSPDDFMLLTPKADTKMTLSFLQKTRTATGSFDETLLFREYLRGRLGQKNNYGAFLNGDDSATIYNHLNPDGPHIVFFKDSYTNSMAPYIALLCSQVDLLDARNYKEETLRFLQKDPPDFVCVSVTNSMGAHYFDFAQ